MKHHYLKNQISLLRTAVRIVIYIKMMDFLTVTVWEGAQSSTTFMEQLLNTYMKHYQMKNDILKIATLCILCILTTQAFAQKGFQVGIRYIVQKTALVNNSDKNAGPELDKENTVGYLSGGIAIEYNFCRNMGIEVDVLHSRQGQLYSGINTQNSSGNAYNYEVAIQATLNNMETSGEYQAKAELNCTKIPVLFKLTTDNTKRHYYTLSAGPQVNLLNSAVYELNGEDIELPGINIQPEDTYRKVTLDGVVAIGAAFNLSKYFVLSGQARFDYGFQDVEKKGVTYNYNNSQHSYYPDGRSATHNATAALMIGISYKL